jgi:hypothetical protein
MNDPKAGVSFGSDFNTEILARGPYEHSLTDGNYIRKVDNLSSRHAVVTVVLEGEPDESLAVL